MEISFSGQDKKGLLYALIAFSWWGALTPLYIKVIDQVPTPELLCHRIIWSLPICLLMVHFNKGWAEIGKSLARREVVLRLLLTACLVGTNWLLFIYAIASDQMLEASLGYYINPLVSVALGFLFLKERLRRLQVAALVIAGLGTLNQTFNVGHFPWIAITLAVSFAFYGLLRKTVAIGAVGGLLVETAVLTPPAAAYLLWLQSKNELYFLHHGLGPDALLLLAGVITAVPLIFFTAGARILPLSMVGFMQYIAPSMVFLLAVFVYAEPFDLGQFVTFGCIWAGLALFTWDALKRTRHRRSAQV